MKFGVIIQQAGLCSRKFPRAAIIPIKLYDGKDRELTEVHYTKELFADNTKSAVDFFSFLGFLEQKSVDSMDVKIDENSVIVFHNTKQAISFKRTKSLDPMDYMD